MNNILVTGGAGFIGSLTVKELIREGFNPIIYDNFLNDNQEYLEKIFKVTMINGDIRDQKLLGEILNDYQIDAVIHFAAFSDVRESNLDPIKYYDNNLIGSIKLIESIIKQKKGSDVPPIPLIFSSTCSVYGVPKEIPIKEKV